MCGSFCDFKALIALLAQPPFEEKSFKEQVKYNYRVFSLGKTLEPPLAFVGNVGDLAIGNDIIWVKYANEWRKSSIEKDEFGRPLQRHPSLSRRLLYETEWKSDKKPQRPPVGESHLYIVELIFS